MEQTALIAEVSPVTAAASLAAPMGAAEFAVNNKDFLRELSNLQRIIPRKTTIPILLNIHIQAVENALMLTASDTDVSLRTVCPAAVKKEGQLAIPAHKLCDYVRLLQDGNVTIRQQDNQWVQIKSGRSHTKMVGMAAESYPKLPLFPAATAIKLDASAMRMLIARTQFAISVEETRYMLNGALMIVAPDGLTMVATDGNRMAHLECRKATQVAKETRILIPRKALMELSGLLSATTAEHILFAQDDATLYFAVGSRLLTCRQLSGRFPAYEAVMPQNLPHKAEVSRQDLSFALQRVAQFSDEKSNGVKLRLGKNEFKLASSNATTGESEDVLKTDYAGDPVAIAFNSQFLLDFLRAVDCERVSLHFSNTGLAIEFRPDEGDATQCAYRYIVMQLRM